MRFRVGVATGEALVDVAAARDGGQAIVAGDVVNTASRLQSVAPPGGVLVCGSTYALTKDTDPLRRTSRRSPCAAARRRPRSGSRWRRCRAAAPPTGSPTSTPLVDREHELGLLVNALHRTLRERHARSWSPCFGHAGIGKSRLVRELFQHADRLIDEPVAWRTGRCPPFGENVTYAALADIVKAEAGILDTDTGRRPPRQRLDDGASPMLVGPPEADRLTDALARWSACPASRLAAEDAESAWRRFLVALAARRPTVLVFEDLHWADESDAALRRAARRVGPRRAAAAARAPPGPELIERRPELGRRDHRRR